MQYVTFYRSENYHRVARHLFTHKAMMIHKCPPTVTLSWLTGTLEDNRAIFDAISNTCAFPTGKSQNVCCEKGSVLQSVLLSTGTVYHFLLMMGLRWWHCKMYIVFLEALHFNHSIGLNRAQLLSQDKQLDQHSYLERHRLFLQYTYAHLFKKRKIINNYRLHLATRHRPQWQSNTVKMRGKFCTLPPPLSSLFPERTVELLVWSGSGCCTLCHCKTPLMYRAAVRLDRSSFSPWTPRPETEGAYSETQ